MPATSYPILALIAALAALAVAGSALMVRSQIIEQPQRDGDASAGEAPALARRLSNCLFGMAALMVLLAVVLELGDTISGLVGFSSTYICEGVLALSIGVISTTMRHSYRSLRRSDGHG